MSWKRPGSSARSEISAPVTTCGRFATRQGRDALIAGTDTLLSRVRPGTIILAHDGGIPDRTRTMQSLPQLLDGLTGSGYRIVSVSELEAAGLQRKV